MRKIVMVSLWYLLLAFILVCLASIFVGICVAISMLPFMTEVDGGTYFFIFGLFCIVLLMAVFSYFSPSEWLKRRIKWLSDSGKQKVDIIGRGKLKVYYAVDNARLMIYEYHPMDKLMKIMKTTQIALDNSEEEYERHKKTLNEWAADKTFIEHCDLSELDSLGEYNLYFTIPKAKATKVAMRELREFLSLPDFDASKVCECFKLKEAGGTFFLKYRDCRIDMLVYTHEDGKTEIFDPKANTLDDENYSEELVSFYLDFYDIYCSNIEEKHRIESQDWPVTQNNKAVGV